METKQTTKLRLRATKLWIIARQRPNQGPQKRHNETIENIYNQLLSIAKLHTRHEEEPVFERNYRNDKTDSLILMHAYMSSQVYLLLECDCLYDYYIQYAFYRCPFEKELVDIIDTFPFRSQISLVDLKPDYSTFYRRVLDFQEQTYVSIPGR